MQLPLHWAAQSNRSSAAVIQVLIDTEPDIEFQNNACLATTPNNFGKIRLCILAANSNGNPHCHKKTISKAGADVNARNYNKRTAEELLQGNTNVKKRDKEIAKQLLQGKKTDLGMGAMCRMVGNRKNGEDFKLNGH